MDFICVCGYAQSLHCHNVIDRMQSCSQRYRGLCTCFAFYAYRRVYLYDEGELIGTRPQPTPVRRG